MPVTTAQEYRAKKTPRDVVPLTRGDAFEIRPVNLVELAIFEGLDPDAFERLAADVRAAKAISAEAVFALISGRGQEVARLVDAVVCAACLNPRVTREYQPQTAAALTLMELDLIDKLAIFKATALLTERTREAAEAAEAATAPAPSQAAPVTVGGDEAERVSA